MSPLLPLGKPRRHAIFTNYAHTDFPEIGGHTFYLPPLGPSSLVIDLGGASAGFSREVNRLTSCQCHVVEATSNNFALIEETDFIHKHHFAIGGREGPMEIWLETGAHHWGSVLPNLVTEGRPREEVPGTTLDAFFRQIGAAQVDLLKVDIEGAEIELFDSAPDQLLAAIAQITVEFHDFLDPSLTEPVLRIKRRLCDLGFHCIVFTQRFHGDVLFLNKAAIDHTPWQRWRVSYPIKYSRGIRRMCARRASTAASA